MWNGSSNVVFDASIHNNDGCGQGQRQLDDYIVKLE